MNTPPGLCGPEKAEAASEMETASMPLSESRGDDRYAVLSLPYGQISLCVLHLFNNSGESCGVVESEVGEDLAVDLDTALVDETHQLGVAEVVHAGSGIDTLNPECTEVVLLILAVAVSISKTFFPGVFSYGPYITAAAIVASCKFEDFFTTCARCNVVD